MTLLVASSNVGCFLMLNKRFHASTCFWLSRSNFGATTRAEKPATPGARDTTMTFILYKLLNINFFKQLY